MATKYVRARKGTPALLHPDTGALVVPSPEVPVDDKDPLVKAFPWAFASDEDLAAEAETRAMHHGPVETATAAPGEKRSTKRS